MNTEKKAPFVNNPHFTDAEYLISSSVMGETAIISVGNPGKHIATLPLLSRYAVDNDREYKANAALLSAAPKMFHALIAASDFISCNGGATGNYIDIVNDALRAALGETA